MQGQMKLAAVARSTPTMAEALPDLPMRETVLIRLMRVAISGMTEYFDPVLRSIGLSENSFHVLCLLVAADQGRASPSELSELVGTSRANMTRILEQLERDGHASRAVEALDARRHVIQITPKGRRVTAGAVPQMIEPLKRAFSDLTLEESALLDSLLRKMIVSFDKGARALKATA